MPERNSLSLAELSDRAGRCQFAALTCFPAKVASQNPAAIALRALNFAALGTHRTEAAPADDDPPFALRAAGSKIALTAKARSYVNNPSM